MIQQRRALLKHAIQGGVLGALSTSGLAGFAQVLAPLPSSSASSTDARVFAPALSDWRTFEVTTRVDIQDLRGAVRVWLPLPSLQTPWQETMAHQYQSNGQSVIQSAMHEGAQILCTTFAASETQPFVEVTSRVRTKNRQTQWKALTHEGQPVRTAAFTPEASSTLAYYTRATRWLPTDGIVKTTALEATRGSHSAEEKVRALYDWVVKNTYREPKVLGCGEGDIKTMLETGNLGGKCADINAVFVGLCRSLGLPARDVYGLRLVPSRFSYKELSGNPANLSGAQHCRSEVYLPARGWVAMDPADVAKVMRQETPTWIKELHHPVVQPVYASLFGGWEGNWLGYNTTHDVALAGSREKTALPFLMYPVAENELGRLDSYAPDKFKYKITAREMLS
jgi:transglutaminase-like putative cysteine protease